MREAAFIPNLSNPKLNIPGGPKKTGTVNILGLCSDQQLSFFTLLDRAYFPH